MTTRKPIIVAEGDSWFSHPKHSRDILDRFESGNFQGFQYEVHHAAHHSDRLEDMVCKNYQRKKVKKVLSDIHGRGREPKVILLSGGGNDIVKALHHLINHKNLNRGILNSSLVRAFIMKFPLLSLQEVGGIYHRRMRKIV